MSVYLGADATKLVEGELVASAYLRLLFTHGSTSARAVLEFHNTYVHDDVCRKRMRLMTQLWWETHEQYYSEA